MQDMLNMDKKGSIHFRKVTIALMSIMIPWDVNEEWILRDHVEVILSLWEAWTIYWKICTKAVVIEMLSWSQPKRSKSNIPTPCRINMGKNVQNLRQKCLNNYICVEVTVKIINPVSPNELICLGFVIKIVRQGQKSLKVGRCAAVRSSHRTYPWHPA